MKQPIRFFALGLLTAGIIMLAVFYFSNDKPNNPARSTEALIQKIESNGYHVMTESEYISASVRSDENNKNGTNAGNNQDDNTNDKDSQENESKSNQTNTYTLTIESGTASSTISNTLQEHNIIENADAFSTYMENEGYSKLVQLGTFELNSDMSHNEIAEAITS
ncbi:hypothetical protein GCM10008983_20610 [Lentibacillus halophilus]|uniref:YceG-like family protein n=1 Tax=Lentibacillus halophilus TaxID=295065 RepID=A0ABN0ZCW7_9BACI